MLSGWDLSVKVLILMSSQMKFLSHSIGTHNAVTKIKFQQAYFCTLFILQR